ncbi:Hypothetical Protein PANA_1725 [Pantoea ananatis LMG 20103]|uniref:Uncharacterized protein n=1 Tax=Pantoea ananatis (strain LMG 20103) TaxID=706191 RepID=D4GDK5_PANAM|nr:Hypothetical Protein PANA_1725 [Pantoea ananatis LMG 20103]
MSRPGRRRATRQPAGLWATLWSRLALFTAIYRYLPLLIPIRFGLIGLLCECLERGIFTLGQDALHRVHNSLSMGIDFDVDSVAKGFGAESGSLQRLGDKINAEFCFGHVAYGQTDTVDAHKSFVQDIFHLQRILNFKPDFAVVFRADNFADFSRGHDVAGHQVAANFIAEFCRPLDIHHIALLEITKIGHAQSFFDQVKTHQIAVDFGDGQAAAVMGNRCAQR